MTRSLFTMSVSTLFFRPSLLIRAALILGGIQLGAHAQAPAAAPPAVNARAVFDKADGDHNGELSRIEVAGLPTIAARFDTLDSDRNGGLSFAEFSAGLRDGM
jgi:EF hand